MDYLTKIRAAVQNAGSKGFFHLFSANIATSLLAFGSQLLVIKFLTPAEMADIKTMQSFVGVAVVIAGFGFNAAVLKLCSEQRPDAERAAIFWRSLRYTFLPIVLVLIAMAIAAQLGLFSPSARVNSWMLVFMLSVPATALASVLMMYLQARKRIKLMAAMQTAIRIGGVTVIVISTYFYGFGGFVIAGSAVAIAALVPLIKTVRGDIVGLKEKTHHPYPEIWYYARWSLSGNLVTTIISYLDILMLNYFISDRVGLGYYSIATIFILGLNQVTTTVQAIATPYFSEYSRDETQFMRVLRKYQKMLIAVAFGLTAVSMIAVPWLIVMLYGDSYAPAGDYFRILAIKYFLWSCYALLGIAIWGIGKMKFSFYSVLASLLISSVVSYFLIMQRGLPGAAIAQVVSYLLNLIIVVVVAKLALNSHFRTLAANTITSERRGEK